MPFERLKGNVNDDPQTTQPSAQKPRIRRQLQGDWVELESADGELYFANIKTKETSWDPPEAAFEPQKGELHTGTRDGKENAVPDAEPSFRAVARRLEASARNHHETNSRSMMMQSFSASRHAVDITADQTFADGIDSSILARESHAVSDLAELANMSTASLTPSYQVAGVGVLLEQEEEGDGVRIERVFRGGPADLSGKVHVGDEVMEVNGHPVNGRPPSELRQEVVGPLGLPVRLGLRKAGGGASWRSGDVIQVVLIRKVAQSYTADPAADETLDDPAPAASLRDGAAERELEEARAMAERKDFEACEARSQCVVLQDEIRQLRAQQQQREGGGAGGEAVQRLEETVRRLEEENSVLRREVEERGRAAARAAVRERELEEQLEAARAGGGEEVERLREGVLEAEAGLEREKERREEAVRREQERQERRLEERVEREQERADRRIEEAVERERERAERKEAEAVEREARKAADALDQERARSLAAMEELREELHRKDEELQHKIAIIDKQTLLSTLASDPAPLSGAKPPAPSHALRATPPQPPRGAREASVDRHVAGGHAEAVSPPLPDPRHRVTPGQRPPAAPSPDTHQRRTPGVQITTSGAGLRDPSPHRQTMSPAAAHPQSVPHLVRVLGSSAPLAEKREAVHALGVAAIEGAGRAGLLQHAQGVAVLADLLWSQDGVMVRYATLALGNLAMDEGGRAAILDARDAMQCLARLVPSHDQETARYAAMAIGNLVLEQRCRVAALSNASLVPSLVASLHSADRQTVRYAAGALRNIAVEDKGRGEVLSVKAALGTLGELTASQDASTARYAAACLKNLNLPLHSQRLKP